MNNEWLNDARLIPDGVMPYLRKIAVRNVVERRYSPDATANFLGVSRTSVYQWLNWYKEGGYDALETRTAPGAEPRITPDLDIWLQEVVLHGNPSTYGYDTDLWTCQMLADILKKEFGVVVGASAVDAHLIRLGLSYQKPQYVARERNAAEVERFLHIKFPLIQRVAERIGAEIAFEDESGVDVTDRSGRTWGLIGHPPVIQASGQRGRVNVFSLVTREGLLKYKVTEATINSDAYIGFLESVLKDRTRPIVLLLDNARFHNSKAVRDFVRNHRALIRVFFLPRYSPEYNPAEQVWSEIKGNKIGRQPIYSREDLKSKLQSALEALASNTSRVMSFFGLSTTEYVLG
jgi:transposase